MEQEKKYCKDCRHLFNPNTTHWICTHPENRNLVTKENSSCIDIRKNYVLVCPYFL